MIYILKQFLNDYSGFSMKKRQWVETGDSRRQLEATGGPGDRGKCPALGSSLAVFLGDLDGLEREVREREQPKVPPGVEA